MESTSLPRSLKQKAFNILEYLSMLSMPPSTRLYFRDKIKEATTTEDFETIKKEMFQYDDQEIHC